MGIEFENIIDKMRNSIGQCMQKDQFGFTKDIQFIQTKIKAKYYNDDLAASLSERIESSMQCRLERANRIPTVKFPCLPVTDKKETIAKAILDHQVVVICGETGSGKTTQIPKICLSIGRGVSGFIGHTQPRRIAAQRVALRIADELGQTLGETIGYKIRFQDRTTTNSIVKLMTDGILLAETQSDPYLSQYDTLILDEAHERSLNIDFLLGYLKWLLPKRPDLKLIITSATIDPERFSKHFNDAPILTVSGRSHPVDIHYRPAQDLDGDETNRDLQQAILGAVDELHRQQMGDILIFLTGEREIRETAESLRKHHPDNTEILPLYSRVSAKEQARIFKPHNKIRIVLATNVAETSLTVPGIRCVIDAGHVRISRYSYRNQLQRLPIEKISKASANQRAGRCGRIGPGICIRLYSLDDFDTRSDFTEPEILRTNLAAVILQMKSLRLGEIARFPFMDQPNSRMIRDGLKLLQELNAIDANEKLTAIGKKLARLPVDPRLGRMILAAEKENCLKEISIITAALSIQDPRERPLEQAQLADKKHAQFSNETSDFLSFLKLWQIFDENKKHLSNSKLRKFCRENFLSYIRMREWAEIHQQIMQVIKGDLKMKPNQQVADYGQVHRSLLTGLVSKVGFKHDKSEYLGARNLKFHIHPSSGLFKIKPKWIVCSETVETTRVFARNVAKVEAEWIEKVAVDLVKRQYFEPHWERKPSRVAVYERVILFGLILQPRRKIPYEKVDREAAREIFIRSALVNQDYDCKATFFQHNKALLTDLEYIQHKQRHTDFFEDDAWLFQFYDERVPITVVNGITFNKWYKFASKEQPNLLQLNRKNLSYFKDTDDDQERFPNEVIINGLKLSLEYCFNPGSESDGVTVIVPIHQINQLFTEPFEWLVPGFLYDKIIALLKSLPKSVRKNLIPASHYADQCLKTLTNGQGSLHQLLAKLLTTMSGLEIKSNDWAIDSLPEYLKFKFRVVDDDGKTLASSTDLISLKQQYSRQADHAFKQLASNQQTQTGATHWSFDHIPQSQAMAEHGNAGLGFPALVDEGSSVGLQIFDTAWEANQQHRRGLIRLFQLKLRKETKYIGKNCSSGPKAELIYNKIVVHPYLDVNPNLNSNLKEDTLYLIFQTVFLDDATDIRSECDFEVRLSTGKPNLIFWLNTIKPLVSNILEDYHMIKVKLQSMPHLDALTDDVNEQLSVLIYAGFLKATPYSRLKEIPRYLKAIQCRLDKTGSNDNQDKSKLLELRPIWNRYWDSVKKPYHDGFIPPESDDFRWSLEEFRVSLFAQVLKTAHPVSRKRLEKAWDKRSR